MKPLLLDTYCKAGGAGMGYSLAGFDVVGVDIEPQPNYPFPFVLGDAIEILQRLLWGWKIYPNDGNQYSLSDISAIHASPVCKGYSRLASLNPDIVYPDQIGELREVLIATGKPYQIENVEGAPLKNYVMLCGSMFGLRVYRHRLFECNPPIMFPPMSCNHWGKASGNKSLKAEKRVTPNLDDFEIMTITGHDFILSHAREAMGIDWMNQAEISQAIPPAYTQWLGTQVIKRLTPHRTDSLPGSVSAGSSAR